MAFKEVDVEDYVSEMVENGADLKEYKKFARVRAEQGRVGQEVITQMKNGLVETKNVVKEDPETEEPDWIVTNPDGEQYIVPDKTFRKKYDVEKDADGYHRPKGGPVKAVQINEDISFMAPWGEKMNIEKGGFLVVNGPKDIYGIQLDEFNNTYKPAQEVDRMFEGGKHSKSVDFEMNKR